MKFNTQCSCSHEMKEHRVMWLECKSCRDKILLLACNCCLCEYTTDEQCNCDALREIVEAKINEPNPNETYCAYCNERFLLDDSAATLVSEHIKECAMHPMREVERERDNALAKLEAVTKEKEGLEVMIKRALSMFHSATGYTN